MTIDNLPEWNGPDRRIEQKERRKNPDRREDLRFEPGKRDRRSGVDRRDANKNPWQDHEV
ncbi:MAG TPA: hypothetical protein VIX81_00390 [Gammaproteobacteria bacterium]